MHTEAPAYTSILTIQSSKRLGDLDWIKDARNRKHGRSTILEKEMFLDFWLSPERVSVGEEGEGHSMLMDWKQKRCRNAQSTGIRKENHSSFFFNTTILFKVYPYLYLSVNRSVQIFSSACFIWWFCLTWHKVYERRWLRIKHWHTATTTMKGEDFALNLSTSGSSHLGSLFTNEERKKIGSWQIWYFCPTCQPCLWHHRCLLGTKWQHSQSCFYDFH